MKYILLYYKLSKFFLFLKNMKMQIWGEKTRKGKIGQSVFQIQCVPINIGVKRRQFQDRLKLLMVH